MTEEPQPSNPHDPAPVRRSLTVPLPSSAGLVWVVMTAIVAILVAALVVEAVRLHDSHHDSTKLSTSQRDAIATATTYAEQFATYDYQSLDRDFELTESHSIEPFLSTYKSETAQIRPQLERLKASSTGKVISAGIASITPTTAKVDLFLDQTISNSESARPRVDTQRVEMTMVRRNNRWLIQTVLLP